MQEPRVCREGFNSEIYFLITSGSSRVTKYIEIIQQIFLELKTPLPKTDGTRYRHYFTEMEATHDRSQSSFLVGLRPTVNPCETTLQKHRITTEYILNGN